MPATKGNKWYLLRTTIGRDKLFETPEILWEECVKYFSHMDEDDKDKEDTLWAEQDWVGKDAEPVIKKHPRPYTKASLCVFLDIDRSTWDNYSSEESYKAFFPVTSRVNDIIFAQKFEGAANGFFNANIIARDLGLTDKTDLTSANEKIQPNWTFEIVK